MSIDVDKLWAIHFLSRAKEYDSLGLTSKALEMFREAAKHVKPTP
tara:strand:+ start:592 stop:726 length:135 start_codon:yes stop_codon:yes gene_type:complete